MGLQSENYTFSQTNKPKYFIATLTNIDQVYHNWRNVSLIKEIRDEIQTIRYFIEPQSSYGYQNPVDYCVLRVLQERMYRTKISSLNKWDECA